MANECITGDDNTIYFQVPVMPSGFEVDLGCTVIAPFQEPTGDLNTLVCPAQFGGELIELDTSFILSMPIKWDNGASCKDKKNVTCGCGQNDLNGIYKCGTGGNSNMRRVWDAHLRACEGSAKCNDRIDFGNGKKKDAWTAMATSTNKMCAQKATFGQFCSNYGKNQYTGKLKNIKVTATMKGKSVVVNNDGRTCEAPWSVTGHIVGPAGSSITIDAICMGSGGGNWANLQHEPCERGAGGSNRVSVANCPVGKDGGNLCCPRKNVSCSPKPSLFELSGTFSKGAACTMPTTPRSVFCKSKQGYSKYDKPVSLPGTVAKYCALGQKSIVEKPGFYRDGVSPNTYKPRFSVTSIVNVCADLANSLSTGMVWALHGKANEAAGVAEAACGGPTMCDITAFKGIALTAASASISVTDEEPTDGAVID